jgi:hypothetical protein
MPAEWNVPGLPESDRDSTGFRVRDLRVLKMQVETG